MDLLPYDPPRIVSDHPLQRITDVREPILILPRFRSVLINASVPLMMCCRRIREGC